MSDIDPTQRIQAAIDTYVGDGYLELDATAVRMLRAVLAENETMRQQLATLKTEWAISHPRNNQTSDCRHDEFGTDEERARTMARYSNGWYVESRLVGPWQPAEGDEQP